MMKGILVQNRYRLCEKIANGFGTSIYGDTYTSSDVAIKLEYMLLDECPFCLEGEATIYQLIQERCCGKPVGFPRMLRYFEIESWCVLVLERLGFNLEQLRDLCGGNFSLKTTLLLADQFIPRLRTVHKCGIVHRDIKLGNFVLGTGKTGNTVYIIDFGLSSFIHERDPNGAEQGEGEEPSLIGTAEFASVSAHFRGGSSRFDDLESLAYLLVHCQRDLPWRACESDTDVLQKKQSTSPEDICKGLPSEFAEFLTYARECRSGEPKYDYWRRQFQRLYRRHFEAYDHIFDWTEEIYTHVRAEARGVSEEE